MTDKISIRVFLKATYNNCAKYSSVLNIVCRNVKLCDLVETYRFMEEFSFVVFRETAILFSLKVQATVFSRHTGKFSARPHGVTFLNLSIRSAVAVA